MNEFIQFLELIKYKAFFNIPSLLSNGSAEKWHYHSVQVITPEGYSFLIKEMRLNYFKPMNKSKNYIEIYWGTMVMQPSQTGHTFNINQDKVYVFHSEQFLALSSDEQISEKAKFSANVSTGSFFDYIYSVIIQIDGSSIADFESFMSMPLGDSTTYGTWRFRFNAVFSYTNLDDFLKYPVDIILIELSLDKIKKLIKKIADEWDSSFGMYNQSQKQEFIFGLLEKIYKDYSEEIYNFFFENGAYYFRIYKSLMHDDDFLKFTFLLLKIFYMKIDLVLYENQVKNLPQNHILPIIHEEALYSGIGYVKKGPYYNFDYTNSGLKINSMLFYIYKADSNNNPTLNPNKPNENLFNYIGNNHFNFDEIIGLLSCFHRKEVGFTQGMVYPVPAFAFEAFQSGLSTDYTIWNFINDLSNAAGVIFPFFKILQAEAVITNLLLLLIGETGLMLDSYPALQEKLKTTSKGRAFLYSYYFVSGFWGNLEQAEVVTNAFRTNKIKAIFDFENLLSMWGAFYADPNDFATVADDPNIEGLKKRMKDIEDSYNDNKKVK